MNNEELYECAISGSTEEAGLYSESDGMEDMPVGWIRIQITRRAVNPEWLMLQEMKQNMVQQMLQQIPPSMHAAQMPYMELQAKAAYAIIEKDTPMYLPDLQEEVFLSDAADVIGEFNEIRESLGLEALSVSEDDDEGDESVEVDKPADGDKQLTIK